MEGSCHGGACDWLVAANQKIRGLKLYMLMEEYEFLSECGKDQFHCLLNVTIGELRHVLYSFQLRFLT